MSPSGDTSVTVDPYALPLMLPKGVDSEGILLDQHSLEVPSLGHPVPSWLDGSDFALSDTTYARSDRSCDHDKALFNNSNPPNVVLPPDLVITPTNIQDLDANFVRKIASSIALSPPPITCIDLSL